MPGPELTRKNLVVKQLGLSDYEVVWRQMQAFTDERSAATSDELWILQHYPVFTLGQAGKTEHLLSPGNVPIVKSDRGGQVTYHGPGQIIAYLMFDLRRSKIGVRDLVTGIEQSIVALLRCYEIEGEVSGSGGECAARG